MSYLLLSFSRPEKIRLVTFVSFLPLLLLNLSLNTSLYYSTLAVHVPTYMVIDLDMSTYTVHCRVISKCIYVSKYSHIETYCFT
jgi:hypothetical protein